MESKLYLKFFKDNLKLFIVFIIVLELIALYFYKLSPTTFKLTRQLEFDYTKDNLAEVSVLGDEAVSLARSSANQKSIGLSPDVLINAYKAGPALVILQSTSTDKSKITPGINTTTNFLVTKFSFKTLGNDEILVSKPALAIFLIIGLVSGSLAGLVVSLLKTYFKNY